MSKELVEIVRCKNCIHRPIKGEEGVHDTDPPKDSRGYEDNTCPCLCDDYWYSWYPSDEWFCPEGESREQESKQDPCNTCGYEEGSIYCKEHCPYEAKAINENISKGFEDFTRIMFKQGEEE